MAQQNVRKEEKMDAKAAAEVEYYDMLREDEECNAPPAKIAKISSWQANQSLEWSTIKRKVVIGPED